ncbi:MAG: translocation/assembly module TamB domain-containing protein [Bryobacterales bacterium]|nr:translocation/assembly module TamB domain-containing protein [Bryobacterales bacterium]
MRGTAKLRRAVRLTGTLLLLLTVALTLAHTPPAKRLVSAKLRERLRDEGIESTFHLDYNLLTLSAAVRELETRSRTAADLPPVVKLQQASAGVALWPLLRGDVHLTMLDARGAALHLVIDSDGRTNLPELRERSPKSASDFLIRFARLTGASLRVEDRRHGVDASLRDLQFEVSGDEASLAHTVKWTGSGSAIYRGQTLPLNVSGDILQGRESIAIRNLSLSSGKSSLEAKGYVEPISKPSLNLATVMQLDLRTLAPLVATAAIEGLVRAELKITGPANAVVAHGTLSASDAAAFGVSGGASSTVVFDATSSRLRAGDLRLQTSHGNASGSVDLALRDGMSSAALRFSQVDLGQASGLLKLPVTIASTGSASVNATWPALDYERASAKAAATLHAVQVSRREMALPVSGEISASIARGVLTVDLAALRALAIEGSGKVALTNFKQLSGDVALRVEKLAASLNEATAMKLLRTAPDVDGAVSARAALSGTIDQPSLSIIWDAAGLRSGAYTGGVAHAETLVTKQHIDIPVATLDWAGQAASLRGGIDLRPKQPLLQLDGEVRDGSIALLLRGLRQDVPASGIWSASFRASGAWNSPTVAMRGSARDLAAYGQTFGTLSFEGGWRGRDLTLDRLSLIQPARVAGEGTVEAKGSYGIDSQLFTLQARGSGLTLDSFTLPDKTAVRGVVTFETSGSGTIADPVLKSNLRISGLRINEYALGDATAAAEVASKQARIEAAMPRFQTRWTSTSAIAAPFATQFEASAQGLDVAALPWKLDPPLTGTLDAVIRGSGEPSNWKQAAASAEISRAEIGVRGQTIRNEGLLRAGLSNGRVVIEPSALRIADSKVTVEGELPLEANSTPGSLRFDGDLNVETLQNLAAMESEYRAAGRLKLQGSATGTFERLIPDLDLTLHDGRILSGQWKPLEIEQLRASIRDGAIRVRDASALWQGAKLSASAEVPFSLLPASIPLAPRNTGVAAFRASLRDLDLSTIPGMPASVSGKAALEATAEAAALELNAVKARIQATALQFQAERYRLEQQGDSVVSIANGIARVEHAQWKGPETQISLFGTAELRRGGALNVRADADMDIAVLSPFAANTRMQGLSRWRLVGFGTLEQPKLAGFVEMNDGRVSLASPNIAAEHVAIRGEFTGDRFEIRTLRGDVNGGRVQGGGHLRYAASKLSEVRLNLNASNVYLNYPTGLKTVSGGELMLRDRGNDLLLSGKLEIVEGSYTDPVTLEAGLLKYLQSRPTADTVEEEDEDSLLSRLRFDVGVRTRNPLVVDNNVAQAGLTANLRLAGTYRNPGLTGRIEIEEGGKLLVAERNYLIERGVITFTNERRIEPLLDVSARTKVHRHDINMLIQGGAGDRIATTLTSDPPLAEEDIASLLVTGRTLEEARGAGSNVAKEQALSLLAGSIGGTLSSQLRRATGISQFRVEPGLIAPESNPTARLTVGQDLARGLSVIYSMNLTDSRDQIYVAQWEAFRRFVTRGVRQSDASFRFEFNHDIRLGGPPAPTTNAERMQRIVRNVRLTGTPVFAEKDVRKKLNAKSGRRYDFFALRIGMEKLEKSYAKRGLLESSVRLTREMEGKQVDLSVHIEPGPAVSFVYEGWDPPGSVRDEVRSIWQRGVFDAQRTDDAVRAIRRKLVEEGYLQAVIRPSVTAPTAGEKQVLFDVAPGVRYGEVRLSFDGVSSSEAEELNRVAERQRLRSFVVVEPAKVASAVTAHYRERGYLDAAVTEPRVELDTEARSAKAVVVVREGSRATVGAIAFRGNRVFEEKALLAVLPVVTGSEFTPALRDTSVERLRGLYGSKGYNDTEVRAALHRGEEAGRLRVEFILEEGRPSKVGEILVSGNSRVSEGLIRSQLPLKPGDPLVLDLLSRARRDLYGTSAFSLVEIDREEMDGGAESKPVRLTVRVREMPPWDLRYGGYFDTERGPGGIADISNRNSLGSARVLGFRGRYDADLREGRLYFAQPLLRRFPVKTVATTFFRRELQPAFRTDRVGFSVQEEARFRKHYLISAGYRLERAETVDRMPDPILGALDPIVTRITPLTATMARDTRDDYLDATRGSLFSHGLEYAPEFLGSQLRYVKYFGQYFKFVPLTKPAEVPFQGGLLRPRLIYAGGVRFGMAAGLGGQTLIPSERFFAGGGTTVRGFAQNTIGPLDFAGDPRGGDAVFVVNNELRFPIYSIVEGVGFSDLGNVYRRASDFALSDLRKSAGFGLRIRTPYFLLRFDYGFKLDRRPGEGLGRLFFSIGQAF